MKAILEFDLPEEDYEHKCAVDGKLAILCLWSIQEDIRYKIKWFPEGKDSKILEGLEEAQTLLFDKMTEYNVLNLVNRDI